MSAAEKVKDTQAYKEAFEDYLDHAERGHCANDRSIWSNCAACDEIVRLLNPEYYCSKCENSLIEDDEQPLVKGICDYCSQQDND